jgi:hypothetical protein
MHELFLIGDSHASPLGYAARSLGLVLHGGPIGRGVSLETSFFAIEKGLFRLTKPEHAERQKLFETLADFNGPILSTVGFNSHLFARQLAEYCGEAGVPLAAISDHLFARCVHDARSGALAFYAAMSDLKKEVYFTCSPQLPQREKDMPYLRRFENVMIDSIMKYGAIFLDVRGDIVSGGKVLLQYVAEDGVHGTELWGRRVIERFIKMRVASLHLLA